jgi:hypothetical protein
MRQRERFAAVPLEVPRAGVIVIPGQLASTENCQSAATAGHRVNCMHLGITLNTGIGLLG